jgi:transposase InsO family protein
MRGVSVPRQADPHTDADAANDPALMVIFHIGARHPRSVPRAIEGVRYLYVAIDKFTKWPEATAVVMINKQSVVKFNNSSICRFGVPNKIITNNESQFTSIAFRGYYEDLGIRICYASIPHPKSNAQVKRANTEIHKGLKTRSYDFLKKHGANWIGELLCALWAN